MQGSSSTAAPRRAKRANSSKRFRDEDEGYEEAYAEVTPISKLSEYETVSCSFCSCTMGSFVPVLVAARQRTCCTFSHQQLCKCTVDGNKFCRCLHQDVPNLEAEGLTLALADSYRCRGCWCWC